MGINGWKSSSFVVSERVRESSERPGAQPHQSLLEYVLAAILDPCSMPLEHLVFDDVFQDRGATFRSR